MEYANVLKSLRAKLSEKATGTTAPEIRPVESLIPSRNMSEMPQQPTEDFLSRSAEWLSEIRQASSEHRASLERMASTPYKTTKGGFAEGFAESVNQNRAERKAARKRQEEMAEEPLNAPLVARRGERPSSYAPDSGEATPVPTDAPVDRVLEAVAAVESRGSGDYAAVGPVVEKGMYKGQRAYGRYQVMEGNIGPWTEEALGQRLTKDEFMASPEAQDAVAAHQLQKSKEKFGTWEDAVSVWFSGRPMSQAGNASDGYLTTPQYINKFRRNFVRV